MPTIFVESAQEFITRHGSNPIRLISTAGGEKRPTSRLLLPSGAEIDGDHTSIRREPSSDPAVNLQWRIKYLELALARENGRYRDVQRFINEQCLFHSMGAGPLPDARAYEDLRMLQASHRSIGEQLAARKAELNELRGPSAWDRRQEERARHKEAARAALDAMAAVTGNPPAVDPLASIKELARESNKQISRTILKHAGVKV